MFGFAQLGTAHSPLALLMTLYLLLESTTSVSMWVSHCCNCGSSQDERVPLSV